MLQIDQKEIQVYSCTFRLSLKKLTIPLKVQGHYYIQWKLKTAKQGAKTSLFSSATNNKNEISIDQTIKLHTQLFKCLKLNQYYKRFTQLTVYLISSRNPTRPKIVGSMMIGLHQVLNNNRYSLREKQKLSFSPLNVTLEFLCQSTQCVQSSIFQSNLDSALLAQENFVVNKQNSLMKLTKQLSKKMSLQSNQHLQDQETYSHGDCSFLQPEKQDICQFVESKESSKHQSILNGPFFIPTSQNCTPLKERIQLAESKVNQSQSYQWLVRQNKNLKKLLLIVKNEKSIELQRLEEEIKDLIRQLSLKEAEILKITQHQQSGSYRVGQLLDQSKALNEKLQLCNNKCQILQEKLNIQKNLNNQLDQNYRRLESRLQLVKGWEAQKSMLLQQIKNLKQENQFLRLKNSGLQNKLEQTQSTYLKHKKAFKSQISSLQSQLVANTSIIQLYEERLTKFEEEISYLQEQQIIHRSSYSSELNQTKQTLNDVKTMSNQQKSKKSSCPISIEEEQAALESINEQDLQQSVASMKADKQIKTSADLPAQEHFQSSFYRKMAKDVQQQLNRLRVLYQQKDIVLKKERMTCKNLYQQLQRLRFQFVYQLSKVTALLNEKIFEIKQLTEQIFRLKAGKSAFLQHKITQLTQEINMLQEQKLQYFDKCYRLQEQNIALIHLSHQKDKVLQLMLQSCEKQSENGENLVQNFERLLFILINNPQKYRATLNKHGLAEQSNLLLQSHCRQQVSNCSQKPEHQLSQLINNFNRQQSNLVTQLDFSQNEIKNGDLLLQSQAKGSQKSEQTSATSKYLISLLQQLVKLNQQRSTRAVSFKKKPSGEDHQLASKKVRLILQNIKKVLLKIDKVQLRQQLLRLVKELEYYLNFHLTK